MGGGHHGGSDHLTFMRGNKRQVTNTDETQRVKRTKSEQRTRKESGFLSSDAVWTAARLEQVNVTLDFLFGTLATPTAPASPPHAGLWWVWLRLLLSWSEFISVVNVSVRLTCRKPTVVAMVTSSVLLVL